eukprot:COSAG01_NODE_40800_length_459_cov_1.694444_1_plen_57_part_10
MLLYIILEHRSMEASGSMEEHYLNVLRMYYMHTRIMESALIECHPVPSSTAALACKR